MEKIHKIGYNEPLKEDEINKIEKDISTKLPSDYKDFLRNYGYGEINGFILIEEPDINMFRLTFQDYLHFWELKTKEEKTIINGIKILSNIDGDIVLLIKDYKYPFVLMPRHSKKIEYFENFTQVLELQISHFKFEEDNKYFYFDSYCDYEIENFSLIINNELDKLHIDRIHNLFIKKFTFDKILNGVQPTYIIQKIGGWIRFDFAYRNSIYIKYQKRFENNAKMIFDELKSVC